MSAYETVIFEKLDHIAYVTLNRPNLLNVYNVRMREELHEILAAIRDDDEVRVAVLKAAGQKAFCAGADLTEFLTAPSPVEARQIRGRRDIWSMMLDLPQPIIAALHGYVVGSGIELAACCDLRIASEDAQFRMPETALGILPAAGGTQTVARLAGASRALEMVLSGNWLSSEDAFRMGLVNKVVARTELAGTVEAIAGRIASLPSVAVRKAKEAVLRGLELPLKEALLLEERLFSLVRTTNLHPS